MRRLVLGFGVLASLFCSVGAGEAISNFHELSSFDQTSLNVIDESFDTASLNIIDESFDAAVVTINQTPCVLPLDAFSGDAELYNSGLDADLVDNSFFQKYERELDDLTTVASWYFGTIFVVLEVTSYFFGYSQWFGMATLCFSGLFFAARSKCHKRLHARRRAPKSCQLSGAHAVHESLKQLHNYEVNRSYREYCQTGCRTKLETCLLSSALSTSSKRPKSEFERH
jgi:hypothetical protein